MCKHTEAGYGGMLGLVSIIVLFVPASSRYRGTVCAAGRHRRCRTNNRSPPVKQLAADYLPMVADVIA
jgi:hypothetical protein